MAKILITGCSGQIGSRLVERLSEITMSNDNIYLLKRARDITNVELVVKDKVSIIEDVALHSYDIAFHLAAGTDTKSSGEEYKNRLIKDNVRLTEKVVNQSGRVLFVSTVNVFKGDSKENYKESDKTNASNFYGITKAMAEEIVLNNKGGVIRIQTIIGVKSNLIVNRVFEAIDGKEYWPFWDDTFTKLAFFEDFFAVAKKSIESRESCIYHVSCAGEPISREDIAYKVLDIHKKHNLPIKKDKFNTEPCNDPQFPRRLVLDTERTERELGYKFTNLDEALEKHVLYARGIN